VLVVACRRRPATHEVIRSLGDRTVVWLSE